MLRRLKIPKGYFFKYRKMGYSVVEAIDATIEKQTEIMSTNMGEHAPILMNEISR